MKTIRTKFDNGRGQMLSARLVLPLHEEPRAYALFAHCFTCSKNLNVVRHIAGALTAQGIAVLTFDFTGLGNSEGEFEDTTFLTNLEDLKAACRWLEAEYHAPNLLIGHSLGGAAVLCVAAQMESVRAVVTIGAPYDPAHVKHLIQADDEALARTGYTEFSIGGRPFKVGKEFLDALDANDPEQTIRRLGHALLVMHSPVDEIVDVDNARKIFVAARHPKSFVSLDRSDHLISDEATARYAGSMIGAWASRFAGEIEDRHDHGGLDALGHPVVVRTERVKYHTDILAGDHALVADEPESMGGKNTGPDPYSYLLTSLGTCTTMTLRMYADRKGWPLEAAITRLRHQKTHRYDCEGCEDPGAKVKIDEITREIELVGDLDDEQRARLLEIADRCPVHRTLHGTIEVRSSLKVTEE